MTHLAFVLAFAGATAAVAQEARVLCGFEDERDVRAWEFRSGTPSLVAEGATQGERALQIAFDPKGEYHPAYIFWNRVVRDWSAYDALVLDVTNPNPEPIPGYILVADQAWADKGRTYWNRHNQGTTFAPGKTEWVLPVRGLYRGEAGSRNNDIKRNIDPDSIVRVDFGFGRKGSAGRVIIDNLRLVKAAKPQGVWAFDFGPATQSLMLGWTAVDNSMAYSRERSFGWGPQGGTPPAGWGRDTGFGGPLLQDAAECGGYNFRVDVPAGRYKVLVFYENCGYWGGEQARHAWRRILANGKEVWREDRPDGTAHALYRFENVEPIPGGRPVGSVPSVPSVPYVPFDPWDTYMKDEIAKPASFEADAGAGGLVLRFEAEKVWGSKVAGIAIHKAGDATGEKWLAGQLDAIAADFRSKAICLDRPAPTFEASDDWKKLGFVAWPVRIEDDITPNSVPPPDAKGPGAVSIARTMVGGEAETFCLAIRPLADLTLQIDATWAPWANSLVQELSLVRYNTSRGFSQIAYRVRPHTLRRIAPKQAVALPKDVTRVIVLKVKAQAPMAAEQRGRLVLATPEGKEVWAAPLTLTLRPVALDRETDYLMGFFGLMPPNLIPDEKRWDILDQTLAMLRDYGMNAVCGGPSWELKGWKDGQPIIDFGDTDRFFELLKKHGFTKEICGYGGLRFRGLHDGYQKGASGDKAEKDSGLPYEEALMRAWRAVDAHARARGWPAIQYAMCDETRVRDVAERELAFMQLMAKVSAAFPKTVRTSGSYSVHFDTRPTDPTDLNYWHQRFFEALDISSLNLHDESVMAEARKLGKEVHIYNQGRDRYSFGLYQWSEWRKGVAARWQWHLNILHGYQFFDLDGREPDTAMICYGRDVIYPTIHFERCREGAEDFYLYNTLWRLVEARRKAGAETEAVKAAARLLDDAAASVKLNQRTPPEGFDPEASKLALIAAIESLAKR